MPSPLASGIDISQFNGNVDIAALRDKVDFIIIRCGYGDDYPSQDDTQYRANVRKCLDNGIPFGVYLYSYARNPTMASSEARHTLRLLEGLTPLYGVWYDLEDSTLPTGQALIDNCLTYCSTLRQAGYYCGLYASLSWMRTRLNSPRLAHLDRWVAQWGPDLNWPDAGLWQYSDRGIINGRVFDMNRAFRDYPAIIGKGEWTDMTKEQVRELAREEAQRAVRENESRYRTIGDVPGWARQQVEEVYRRLELTGSGTGGEDNTQIDASPTYVRVLVVLHRLMEALGPEAFMRALEKEPELDAGNS